MWSAMLLTLLVAQVVVSSHAIVTRATSIDASSLVVVDDLVDLPEDDVHLGADDEDDSEQSPKDSSDKSPEEPLRRSSNEGGPGVADPSGPSEGWVWRVGTTLSPQQRVAAHASKYEAEFVVELNMTYAHETGRRLGIVLKRMTDYDAAKVSGVQKVGLIEEWNKANPGKEVHVGDEIVRVNDIQWHANTRTFIKHIAGQFKAGRKQWKGAEDSYRLYIRRPRVWKHTRFEYQRFDRHRKLYAAEFVAEFPCPDSFEPVLKQTQMSSSKALEFFMGWKLGATEDWKPVIIRKIEPHGAVSDWNKEHPDNLILEGDEVMSIDQILFNHNSSVFTANVQRHFWEKMRRIETNRSTHISIRRPREVQVAFDEAHPTKEIEVWGKPEHRVKIQFKAELAGHLGWEIAPTEDNDSGNGGLVVKSIDKTGLVGLWNEGHPDQSIAPGDHIIEVNGASWELYDTSREFSDLVLSELQPGGHRGPDGELFRLTLERPVRSVMQFRTNMEFGVHMQGRRAMTTTELPSLEVQSNIADGATDDGREASATDENAVGDVGNGRPAGAADDNDDSDVVGAED